MRRTSANISEGVTGLFTKRKLDAATLDDLEDVLIQADLGVETASRITQAIGEGRYDKEIAPEKLKPSWPARSKRRWRRSPSRSPSTARRNRS